MTGAIRERIALVYGAVFLVLGGCLLTVVNLLSSAGTQTEAAEIAARVVPALPPSSGNGYFLDEEGRLAPVTVYQLTDNVSEAASDELMFWSVAALVVMALCAVGVGWWTAGRVLRPVHAMTAKARLLSEHNLHERIGSTGPDDELKELGDTLDELLGRLQKAFDSQKRFIANASHELRTPLATQRTAIQVGLAGAGSPEELARTKELLLDNNRRSEQLIEGLLVLARSEREVEDQEEIHWGDLVTEESARHGLPVTVTEPGGVRGNRALLDRLVGNLLANAQAYGKGVVDVSVSGTALTVRNDGPDVAPEDIPAFFEPFRRGEGRDRMGPGAGLGLSIVRSIVTAHGGTVTARPGGEAGGLSVRVVLPASGA
ncbi:two-component sensor histidine kinase [Streptomyces camponoticapitis]|uniref:histidine kinase n=1 Tax=Streptomyces camponoticapitis TaxID=1616125 RepID=A0ABQ2DZG3_9ACTN|nr:HAMP domain-containing sensor histidine kinase [Streptomyces camponoticapitis]GGJ80889.1 two-component sensor histidine kinase [Streptomyces camponoticapitis]